MRLSILVPSSKLFRNLHLGVTSIATYLNEKSDHRAEIIDFTFHLNDWRQYLVYELTAAKPDLIAITLSYPYMKYATRMIEVIRQHCPGVMILLGGYHASIMADELIDSGIAEIVCIGDGELPTLELLDKMERQEPFTDIPGLYFNIDNRITKNPLRPFLQDVDCLHHLDWTLWKDLDKFLFLGGYLPFSRSRGCESNCSFCDVHQIKRVVPGCYYRLCDPKQYVRDIQYQFETHYDQGFRHAFLYEPTLTKNVDWLDTFVAEYLKTGLEKHISISVYSRVEHVTDDVVEKLQRIGCKNLRIGMESSSDYIRNEILNKQISKKDIFNAVQICRRHGMGVTAYFILGAPGETVQTMWSTFKLAWRLGIERPAFLVYKPFPKSDSLKKLIELGGHVDERRWEKVYCTTSGVVASTPHLKPFQIAVSHTVIRMIFLAKLLVMKIFKGQFHTFTRLPLHVLRSMRLRIHPIWTMYWWFDRDENL